MITAPKNLPACQRVIEGAGAHKLYGGTTRAIMGHNQPTLSDGRFDLLTSTGTKFIIGVLRRSTAGSTVRAGVTQQLSAPVRFRADR